VSFIKQPCTKVQGLLVYSKNEIEPIPVFAGDEF